MVGIVEFVSNLIINVIGNLGYWGVFSAMTLESACIPLPSEIIMTFSGFVVWQGNTNMTLLGITMVGALGNLFGSLIAYFVGLRGGRPLLEKYGKYILITQSKLETADRWFDKYGYEAVLISRVLPGVRTFISLPAGITHMELKRFVIYTFAGSLVWCCTGVYRNTVRAKMGHNNRVLPHIRYDRCAWNHRVHPLSGVQVQEMKGSSSTRSNLYFQI